MLYCCLFVYLPGPSTHLFGPSFYRRSVPEKNKKPCPSIIERMLALHSPLEGAIYQAIIYSSLKDSIHPAAAL